LVKGSVIFLSFAGFPPAGYLITGSHTAPEVSKKGEGQATPGALPLEELNYFPLDGIPESFKARPVINGTAYSVFPAPESRDSLDITFLYLVYHAVQQFQGGSVNCISRLSFISMFPPFGLYAEPYGSRKGAPEGPRWFLKKHISGTQ
jgi:hypothetical protein